MPAVSIKVKGESGRSDAILVEKEGGFEPHEIGLVTEAISNVLMQEVPEIEPGEPDQPDDEGAISRQARNGGKEPFLERLKHETGKGNK